MDKHTPGPWLIYADVPSTDPNWHIVTNDSRLRVIANVHIEPSNEMDKANALLIAAAPELLDALKSAAVIIGHPDDAVSQAIAEIIAKAEGRQSTSMEGGEG